VSMWCLISSESASFGVLLLVFVFFNARPPPGPSSRTSLDLLRTGMFSLCLFSSSWTLWRSEAAEAAGRRRGMIGWLVATVVLGAVFLIGQGFEYHKLYASGMGVTVNLFSSSFYLVTGFHGFHVAMGLLALLIVLGRAVAGDFLGKMRSPLSAVGLYWHFVDVVWVFVLATIYILPRFA
jgi:heme/copper-type cytochrome/quinol oxidase subunit 3